MALTEHPGGAHSPSVVRTGMADQPPRTLDVQGRVHRPSIITTQL